MSEKKHYRFALPFSVLLTAITIMACVFGGESALRNNAVRRAVVAYEIETRGTVDELMVYYSLKNDARDNLGFEDGNTVWMRDARYAKEYIERRDYSLSYVIIQEIEYPAEGEANVKVIRGDSDGYVTRQLTLLAQSDRIWTVVMDVEEQ